jgi:hypothetical protein
VAGDRAADALAGQARLIRDLMRTAGPAANGMITSSRELEAHLRVLHYTRRLAASGQARARTVR